MAEYDVVVIGAGHNGLAAALVLAKAGLRVLVVESRPVAGGAAKSGEISRPGFIHDYYASNVGLFLGSAIYREFGTQLHNAGMAIDVADQPYGSVFPDGRAFPIYKATEATEASIRAFSEPDVLAWRTLLSEFNEVSPYLFSLLQSSMPSWVAGRTAWRMVRRLGWTRTQELFAELLQSPRQFVESRFESPEMQALLIPWAYHLDFAPDTAAGATFPFLESMADYVNGMAIVHGGISRLIDSMVAVLRSYGGDVILNTEVSSIIVHHERAVGVRTTSGDEIRAKRAVMANITPRRLFGHLLDPNRVPSGFLSKVRNFRYGPGTMMVHVALSGPVPWTAKTMERSLYVHIAPYVDDVAQADMESRRNILPGSPLLVVGQQSVWDRSRAPESCETLWVQVRSVPASPRGDALQEMGPSYLWEDIQEVYADRVMAKIEQYAPGLQSKVLARTVLSPMDLERENPNLIGGDSVSGSHHLDQFYLFRPIPGWSRYRTPVKGLWMMGASTWPGAGLNATSGYLAAKEFLRKS